MENSPAILPSNDAGEGDASTSTSASSLSSVDVFTVSTAAPSLNDYDDDEDVCRICRNPGDIENPLRFPCACRGSIKYVHQDCLLLWLNHSNAHQCEVCKHAFDFSPVYAENAPNKLPFQEFIAEIAKKTCHILNFLLRISCILSVWILIIPYIDYFIYRLAFVRSFDEAQTLFLTHIFTTNILIDCLLGFLLYSTFTIISLGVTFLRVYFRNLRQLGGPDFHSIEDQIIPGLVLFLTQIEQIIDGLNNVPLMAERVGFWGPVFPLVKFAFSAIAKDICALGIVIFVPISLGRVILYLMFSKELSNLATLKVGYMVISSLFFLYFVILELIRYIRGEPLIMGRFYFQGLAYVKWTIHSLLRYLKIMLKRTFFRLTYFGIFPLLIGWWLDFCSIGMFGNSFAQKVEIFTVSPFSPSHWLVGNLYLLQIRIFILQLQGVVRIYVRIYVRDTAYTNFKLFRYLNKIPMHEQASVVVISGFSIVMLVFLPVKLAFWIAPSIFPFDISVTDALTDFLFIQICILFVINHFKLRTTIKSLLRYWLTIVCSALGLTELLLSTPECNGAHQRRDRDFVVRIVVLIILAWMTLLVMTTGLIILPVSLGRVLFTLISRLQILNGIKFYDMYAFIIGNYVIWGIVRGVRYCIEHIRTTRANVIWMNIRKWGMTILKCSAPLSIWILVIPILIGLLVELLLIVPMRVPVDETPVFVLHKEWSIGFILLQLGTTFVIQDADLIPWMEDTWHGKFERVRANGFSGLECIWVLQEIIVPILKKLCIALCVPYVLAKGVFPVFGFSLMINSVVYRFAWLGCLGFGIVWYFAEWFIVWLTYVHNSIRDERYLIGRTLRNFGEDRGEHPIQQEA